MCTMDKKVSIIIPVYNVSEFLDECVESACNQTYSNIEIILVDDGSTDDSGKKCDVFEKIDGRIRVVHKENGGLSSARNAGLDIATGEYIYFLDSDDYIENTLLEKTIHYMNDGYDMVIFGYNKVYMDGRIEPLPYHMSGKYIHNDEKEKIDFLTRILLKGRVGWEAWSRIYRRDIIEKFQLRFVDNKRIFAEDLYFCLCYSAHVKRFLSIDSLLYYYRQRDNSIMGCDAVKLNVGRMNELAKEVLNHYSIYDECRELINIFPVIHYMIVNSVISKYQQVKQIGVYDLRKDIFDDLTDKDFFIEQLKKVKKYRKLLYPVYDKGKTELALNEVQYYLDNRYLMMKIRQANLKLVMKLLRIIRKKLKKYPAEFESFLKEKKKIYFIGSEDFGNLGDQQIAESIQAFIKKYFSDYAVKEITASDYYSVVKLLKKNINSSDVIFLAGGGNFGNEYMHSQLLRNDVIKRWKNNLKIIFPQTIYFNDSEQGIKALREAEDIYVKENNIILFTRERNSYDFAQEHFSCESYLVPDIVLLCNEQGKAARDNVIRLCMRSDAEKSMTNEQYKRLNDIINQTNIPVEKMDLQLDYHVSVNTRKEEIENKMQLMRTARLIITDRLHGMVFAAITGTPCVAFSNYNYKVSGTYEWIKYLSYIRFVENIEDAEKNILDLLQISGCEYDNSKLMPCFDRMSEIIRNKISK